MSEASHVWSRRLGRRSVIRGVTAGGLGVAGAALIGCGSGTPATAPAGGGTTPAAAAPGKSSAPAGEQPQVSDAFVAVQTRDAPSLEPLDSNVYTIPERIGLVYPRLLFSALEDPKDQTSVKWVPSWAVASWEQSDGGRTLTFKLKPGMKYQNVAPLNGREFTSADVKFSIDRYMTHERSTFKNRFSDLDKIETPDKLTAVFKLKRPSRYLISSLGAETALISPPEIEKEYKTKVIGAGPYIHEQYLQNEGSTLRKNPDFIDAKNVWYNRFLFKVMPDAASRTAAMKTGQVDFGIGGLTKADLATVQGPNVTTYPLLSASGANITWNLKNPKWADYRIRLAMSKAFDRQSYIDQTQQGQAKWSGIVQVDFGKWALTEAEVKAHNVMKYDVAEAKKLFDAAGGKPGMAVEFYFSSNGTVDGVQAQFLQKAWDTNLGIKMTPKTEDYSIYLPKAYLGNYPDMCTTSYSIPNWMEHLFAPYLKGGNRNGSNFEDAEVTKMMDDLKSTLDDKAAADLSRKIQLHIWEKHLPMTQRPTPVTTGVYNAKLRNFPTGNHPPGLEWTLGSWKGK
jgi:peptide/nickel transport system substrate-binding protein